MNKPEFLKGDVREFIDVKIEFTKRIVSIKDYKELVKCYDDIACFYSQPFSVSIIGKYFDGWSTVGSSETYACYDKEPKYNLVFGVTGFSIIDFVDDAEIYRSNYQPQTLSHFISDCIRCGINLKWKE